MAKFVVIAIAAAGLMQSAVSVAVDSSPKSSSFVPHARSNNHVYGAPIHPAILGHAKVSSHKHAQKKPSSGPKK